MNAVASSEVREEFETLPLLHQLQVLGMARQVGTTGSTAGIAAPCPLHRGDWRLTTMHVKKRSDGPGLASMCPACGVSAEAEHLIAATGGALGERLERWKAKRGHPPPRARDHLPQWYPPVGVGYPPDAGEFWAELAPVSSDSAAMRRLRAIGADPFAVEAAELARVLPPGVATPSWACSLFGHWQDTDHRLVVPLHDAAGEILSVVALRIDAVRPAAGYLTPGGCLTAGLVMCDAFGRALLLAGGQRSRLWCSSGSLGVEVAQGAAGFLRVAARLHVRATEATAAIGVLSGGWTPEIAERMPFGTLVLFEPELVDGRARDIFARITETLGGRGEARWTQPGRKGRRS